MTNPTEKSLHKDLVKLLKKYQKTKDFVFYHLKNDVGARRDNFFYDLKPLGVLPGVADFCFLMKGETAYLEIKTETGRLSQNQKDFLIRANRLGHPSYAAFGWDDILDKVDQIIQTQPAKHRLIDSKVNTAYQAGNLLWMGKAGEISKKRKPKTTSIFVY